MKVICKTKNDHYIIENFINYYSEIVGEENIILIDNGSESSIFNIYSKFPKITVHSILAKHESDELREKMIEIVRNTNDDVLIADSDEFLIYMEPNCKSKLIRDFLIPEKVKLHINNLLNCNCVSIPEVHAVLRVPLDTLVDEKDQIKLYCKNFDQKRDVISKCSIFDSPKCCNQHLTVFANKSASNHIIKLLPGNHHVGFDEKIEASPPGCWKMLHITKLPHVIVLAKSFKNLIGYGYITDDMELSIERLRKGKHGKHKAKEVLRFIQSKRHNFSEETWKSFVSTATDTIKCARLISVANN